MIRIINDIDVNAILNNFENMESSAYKLKENNYAVFIEPDYFKQYGYNELGFMINKTEDWLKNATKEDLKDATTANKIIRVTRKTGVKWQMKVTTLMYIVNSTFYKSKIGNFLCSETM